MKHTKGPWSVYAGIIKDVHKRILARVTLQSDPGDIFLTRAEADANADLIAASPDLLEALYEARGLINNLAEQGDIILYAHDYPMLLIESAIAKAEGRKP